MELDSLRGDFAERIRRAVGVESEDLLRAFASVPRERFVGPGPWQISDGTAGYRTTPDDDPRMAMMKIPEMREMTG